MANVYARTAKYRNKFHAEMGNTWQEKYVLDKTAAAIADKIYLGVIPAGIDVTGMELIGDAAGATGTIGYEPFNPVEGPVAVADYFFAAGTALNGARKVSNAKPITFERDVWVTITVAGANIANTAEVFVVPTGRMVGFK